MHSENLHKDEKDRLSGELVSEICKATVGPFNITCNGEMEYDEDEMVLICKDCGNTRDLL